ncbi:LPXTG cell wall anchor domain-containing protein [Brevibacterium casei]
MRLPRTLAALTIAGLLALGTGTAAEAAPTDTAIQMSWDGSAYSDTTTETFVGFPVTVPGDSTSRTLTVRNDGPTDGTLTVSIVDVDLLTADIPDEFYDDLRIDWKRGSSSIKDLAAAGTTRIMEIPLAKGETTPVTIGYDFPIEATSGNKSNVGARQGSFDVLLELGGDATDPDGGAGSDGSGKDSGSDGSGKNSGSDGSGNDSSTQSDASSNAGSNAASNAGSNSDGTTADGGYLPRTGGAMWWMAILGAVLAGAGAAMVRAVRRRN